MLLGGMVSWYGIKVLMTKQLRVRISLSSIYFIKLSTMYCEFVQVLNLKSFHLRKRVREYYKSYLEASPNNLNY
jgi:hypothetical protein